MTQLQNELQNLIRPFDLLQTKFYQAWSAGTLPVEAIREYASEYGAFIAQVADGWEAHGDLEIAAEEREHLELWREFAKALGTDLGMVSTPEVQELVDVVRRHFSEASTSLGALFAFESQQPFTAASKLKGLREHYRQIHGAEQYFEVHKSDFEEPALLLERMEALPADEQARAKLACAETARALHHALEGLYLRYGAGCCES